MGEFNRVLNKWCINFCIKLNIHVCSSVCSLRAVPLFPTPVRLSASPSLRHWIRPTGGFHVVRADVLELADVVDCCLAGTLALGRLGRALGLVGQQVFCLFGFAFQQRTEGSMALSLPVQSHQKMGY
jgi:hypothetical protein